MGTRFGVEKSKVEQHEDKDEQKESFNKAKKDCKVTGVAQDGEGTAKGLQMYLLMC